MIAARLVSFFSALCERVVPNMLIKHTCPSSRFELLMQRLARSQPSMSEEEVTNESAKFRRFFFSTIQFTQMADAACMYWAEAGCGLAEVTHAVRGLGIRVVRWYPDKIS